MCKFCTFDEDGFSINEIEKTMDLGILGNLRLGAYLTESKSFHTYIVFSDNDRAGNSLDIKINYCPICGRKL